MFLYPPRPTQAIMPAMLGMFEKRGYRAEVKRNGTCSVAHVDKAGDVEFWTRHGEAHKAWTPTGEAVGAIQAHKDSTFVFELLHSKGGGVRNTLYFFDVLRFSGVSLVGTTLLERRKILKDVIQETPNVSVAKAYKVFLSRGLSPAPHRYYYADLRLHASNEVFSGSGSTPYEAMLAAYIVWTKALKKEHDHDHIQP